MEIAGTQAQEDFTTVTINAHGNKSTERAYIVVTTSGDKLFVRTRGSSTLKDVAVQTGEGKWTFTGRTG